MKRIQFNVVFTFVLLGLWGCEPEEISPGPLGFSANAGFVVEVISNEDGRDLLNPVEPSAITLDDLQHYYLINGRKQLQNHPHLSNPKHLHILAPNAAAEDGYRLMVYLNVAGGNDGHEISSIIEYSNSNKADTITATIVKTSGYLGYKNPRVNGVLVPKGIYVLKKD